MGWYGVVWYNDLPLEHSCCSGMGIALAPLLTRMGIGLHSLKDLVMAPALSERRRGYHVHSLEEDWVSTSTL